MLHYILYTLPETTRVRRVALCCQKCNNSY